MFSFDFRKTPAWDYQRPLLRLNPQIPFHFIWARVPFDVGTDYAMWARLR